MSLRWKDTCRFDGLHAAMVLAAIRAEEICAHLGEDCWITSANDSRHMDLSKHYDGRALDLRVHHIEAEANRTLVALRLRAALGPQFTVIYEDAGTPNAHIHVQFNGT